MRTCISRILKGIPWCFLTITIAFAAATNSSRTVAATALSADSYVAPRRLSSKPVGLPLRAQVLRLQGTVLLEFTVSKRGRAESPQIIESSGSDVLDLCAAKSVTEWKYAPAQTNGKPIEEKVRQEISFEPPAFSEMPGLIKQLEEKNFIKIGRRGSGPLATKRGFSRGGQAIILFTLDDQGYVSWIKLLKSSGRIELDYLAVVGPFGDMQFSKFRVPGQPIWAGSEKIQVPKELGPIFQQTWEFRP